MEVSADWSVDVEHQRLSSIRVIFVNYQTSELQYNYQSYTQVYTIGGAWGFSNIALVTPSGGFSGKILTGVRTLLQETKLERSIPIIKDGISG